MVKESFNQNLTDGQKHLGQQIIDAIKMSPDNEDGVRDCIKIVQKLLKHGAPVNYQDPRKGSTALHHAVAFQEPDIAELIMAQPDVDYLIRDKYKRLPAYMASGELAEKLLRKTQEQASQKGIFAYELHNEGINAACRNEISDLIGKMLMGSGINEEEIQEGINEMNARGLPVSRSDIEDYLYPEDIIIPNNSPGGMD